jgi:phage-related baseplate assembly protein
MSSFDNLPDIEFCSTDAEIVESSVITVYQGVAGKTLYPGDPVRLFLEALAAIIVQQNVVINYTGKQNLLKFSEKDVLDHIGAFTETERLGESSATTTVRFSIDQVMVFAVPISQGKRVSPDGQLMFATTAAAEIAAGETHVDVMVECETAGGIGNGFVVGQINKMVDPIDYVSSVSNTTTSSGGADQEEDDPYRNRIHTAPESFSVAGPTGAYEHWAMSAHQDIVDVSVFRTSPLDDLTEVQLETILDLSSFDYTGMTRQEKQIEVARWLSSAVVHIVPLLSGGVLPGQAMLDLVEEKVDDRTIRPLTDQVLVAAPAQVSYDIELTYYISSENHLAVPEIQAAVVAAADAYIAWQREKLGRDVNPSKLESLLVQAGAHRVSITTPVYAPVGVDAVAQEGTVSLIYGGLEDD